MKEAYQDMLKKWRQLQLPPYLNAGTIWGCYAWFIEMEDMYGDEQ